MTAKVFDSTRCQLGEGPLWLSHHNAFLWFDILGKRAFRKSTSPQAADVFEFPEMVSAAAETQDVDTLIVASETALLAVSSKNPNKVLYKLCDLEADNPVTRSNDGRADPQGGFWIGTMGKSLEPGAGGIYRYYKGALRQIYDDITVPNAICFSADGKFVYFTDTLTQTVMVQGLDSAGWPTGTADVFLDLTSQGLNPDGAIMDDQGNMYLACWGASAVIVFDRHGHEIDRLTAPARQISCPAIGGQEETLMIATSAADGVSEPDAGMTFCWPCNGVRVPQHQVIL